MGLATSTHSVVRGGESRARQPDHAGTFERDGCHTHTTERIQLLVPTVANKTRVGLPQD